MRMETSRGNMPVTGALSIIISLRLSMSNWNGLHNRDDFGKAVNVINSFRSVIFKECKAKSIIAIERRTESRHIFVVCKNHCTTFKWKRTV